MGIVTGPASGFWMLGPDGPEGLADLKVLEQEHGPLPPTARVRSGSGGEHLYFSWPTDGLPIPNRRNHRGLKIDVRGCGDGPGYVVAPPSLNANGAYSWLDEREPADAPPWLLAWVRGVSFKATATSARPDAVERARLYLAKCHPAVSGANGHGQTFAVARALCWGFDLPAAVALGLMKELYNPRCVPPWSDADLEHKVNDAHRRDFGKPRGYLNVDLHPERGGRNSGDSGDGFSRNATGTNSGRSNSGDSGDASGGTGSWKPPVALPEMPPVPPFPIEVFPAKVADYWLASARSLAVPVDYVAVPGIALLGAAVGRTRAVGIKKGYTEVPAVWTVVIAPPGSVKSASLKFARAPLAKAEADWMAKHGEQMIIFDTEMDRHAERVKEWRKAGCNGEPPEKPRRPRLRQSTLDSTTTEAAAKVLGDNPRGVVVVKDELSGFVRSMNQYRGGGKGDDRQFWLSAWAGAPAKVNRAKDHDAGPLVIPHPFVGIAGMMTPSSLPELRGDNRQGEAEQDGFVDRFLFNFPDPVDAAGETWDEVSDDLKQGYADVFLDLLGTEMVVENEGLKTKCRPYVVPLDDDARPVWGDVHHRDCRPHEPAGQVRPVPRGAEQAEGVRCPAGRSALERAAGVRGTRAERPAGRRHADEGGGADRLFRDARAAVSGGRVGRPEVSCGKAGGAVAVRQSRPLGVQPHRGVPATQGPAGRDRHRRAGPGVQAAHRPRVHPPVGPERAGEAGAGARSVFRQPALGAFRSRVVPRIPTV